MKVILCGQLADASLISDHQAATAKVLDGMHVGHELQIVTAKPLGGKYYRKVVCNCGRNVSKGPLEVVSAHNAQKEE